jgi:hypothetical protein
MLYQTGSRALYMASARRAQSHLTGKSGKKRGMGRNHLSLAGRARLAAVRGARPLVGPPLAFGRRNLTPPDPLLAVGWLGFDMSVHLHGSASCSGVLVAPDLVATAAHCVVERQDRNTPPGRTHDLRRRTHGRQCRRPPPRRRCGKTTQLPVPWAREGSGFTLLFEALSLSLCREMPVRQAANQLRVAPKRLWRRVRHYVEVARARDDMSGVRYVGIDETSVKRGHAYITVVHDLEAKRLLFATPGRDHATLQDFAQDMRAHGGNPLAIKHACIDMSAAYAKGIGKSLPNAQISYDRFHVVALANAAMDEVRREEMRSSAVAVREAVGAQSKKTLRQLLWGMRKNPA